MSTEEFRGNIQNLTGQAALFPATGSDKEAPASANAVFEITGGEAANTRLLGLASGNLESIQKTGFSLAMSFEKARAEQTERDRQSIGEIAYLTLLDQLNRQIDWLSREIDRQEKSFAEDYGEDWREQMAQRILAPDDIPQRREGESMADYRQRLEQTLIEEMLDENGEIKPDYMSNPELRKWAGWAKDEYEIRQAEHQKAYIESARTEAERIQRVQETGQSASLKARDELWNLSNDEATRKPLEQAYQNERDSAVTASEQATEIDIAAFNLPR